MRHGLTVSSQTRPIPCASTGHLSRDCRLVIGTAKFFLVPAAVALAGLRDIRAGGIPLSWVGQARVINRRKIERDLAEFIGNRMGTCSCRHESRECACIFLPSESSVNRCLFKRLPMFFGQKSCLPIGSSGSPASPIGCICYIIAVRPRHSGRDESTSGASLHLSTFYDGAARRVRYRSDRTL